MSKVSSSIQIILALAIIFLGASLFNIGRHIPETLTVISQTLKVADSLKPDIASIVNEVALVREEVALVRLQLHKQIPEVLSQVSETAPVVEKIINKVVGESERYSEQIPNILTQLSKIEETIASVEKQLPSIFQRIDSVTQLTEFTVNEVALWRPHSTKYLDEINQSKVYIPQYLSRAENIIIDAKSIGSEATSGLVSGFFKGVVALPFEVVAGLTGIVDKSSRSAKYLTAKDVALMQEKVIALLDDNEQLKSIWHNIDSGNRGTIVKGNKSIKNKQTCYKLTFNNHFAKESEELKEMMCRDKKGLWTVI